MKITAKPGEGRAVDPECGTFRGKCDRCGEPVRVQDDCTHFEETRHLLRTGKYGFAGFTVPRHLGCSPSRQELLRTSQEAQRAVEVMQAAAQIFDGTRGVFSEAVRAAAAPFLGVSA